MNYYNVIVHDLKILAVVKMEDEEAHVKLFEFPTWGGKELDSACRDIAQVIEGLRDLGWNDFRFSKGENVSVTNMERVANRIAELVTVYAVPKEKRLN